MTANASATATKIANTFSRITGNQLLEHSEEGGVYRFLIQKVD